MEGILPFQAPKPQVIQAPVVRSPWESVVPNLLQTIVGETILSKIKGNLLDKQREQQQAFEKEKLGIEQSNMMDRIFAQAGYEKNAEGQWQKPQFQIQQDPGSGYLTWQHGTRSGVLEPMARNLQTMNIPGTQKAIVKWGKDSHVIDQSLPFDEKSGPQYGQVGSTGAYWIRTGPNSIDVMKPTQNEPSKEFHRIADQNSPTGFSYRDYSGRTIQGAVPPAEAGNLTEGTALNQLNLIAGADPEKYNKYVQEFKTNQTKGLNISNAFSNTLNTIGTEQRSQRLTEAGTKYTSPDAIKKAFQKGELDQDTATSLLRANHGYQ